MAVVWAQLPDPAGVRQAVDVAAVGLAVARLRRAQRLLLGFLDPVEDALFLTASLRRLGFPATFHIGREALPTGPAGYLPWIECGGTVVSTSAPVREQYVEIFAHPQVRVDPPSSEAVKPI
jgi:hypothetical protein